MGHDIRITPTALFMMFVAAIVSAQDKQFNLLEALNKKPKEDTEEPRAKEPDDDQQKAVIEEKPVEKPSFDLVPMESESKVEEPKVEEPKVEEPKVEEPKVEEPKVEQPDPEPPIEVTPQPGLPTVTDLATIPEIKVMDLAITPSLRELPYFHAFNNSMVSQQPLAVFIVRVENKATIDLMNQGLEMLEDLDYHKYLHVAIIGPNNPNSKNFPVFDSEIEAVGWAKKNGVWVQNNYKGIGQVKWLVRRLETWLTDRRKSVR